MSQFLNVAVMNHGAQEEHFRMLKPLSHEEFSEPILHLKVDVAASCQELRRDGRMPISDRQEKWCGPKHVLEVDKGLGALCRKQRANRGSVTTRAASQSCSPASCRLDWTAAC
jgi:hypothetical protein